MLAERVQQADAGLDAQRTLSQRTFERVRRIELQLGVEPSHYEPGGSPRQDTADREALEV